MAFVLGNNEFFALLIASFKAFSAEAFSPMLPCP
ncbi:hypothetical protein HPSA_03010 [Helicobacter pylori SouthAfrica7]|uniref:Uncharacterized protein n=1 Tax=Helicobacter pylori (strain SouthAfrica7) TaxID=907239 RepID=E8QVY4_HELPW|nr:hypothetical protein HPSA_03010 [Helicobacter pylori SouthAfrica7]